MTAVFDITDLRGFVGFVPVEQLDDEPLQVQARAGSTRSCARQAMLPDSSVASEGLRSSELPAVRLAHPELVDQLPGCRAVLVVADAP
jgi:hypothetical protein